MTKTFQVWYRTFANSEYYYVRLGNVIASDLEDLFRCMNCVDGSDFEQVGRGKRFQTRSMSVGDVAIDETGQGHMCAPAVGNVSTLHLFSVFVRES